MEKDRVVWEAAWKSCAKKQFDGGSRQRISGIYVTCKEVLRKRRWTSERLVESVNVWRASW